MPSFDYDAYYRRLEADADPAATKSLALRLHAAEGSPVGLELDCYSCARWPDDDTPDFDPGPNDRCWRVAAEILGAHR